MKSPTLEDFRLRIAEDPKLPFRTKGAITLLSFKVESSKDLFTMTLDEMGTLLRLSDRHSIYGHIQTLKLEKYVHPVGRHVYQGHNYYQLALDTNKPPLAKDVALALAKMLPRNPRASDYGRLGGSKPKTYSAKERALRQKRVAAARLKRWPKKRSK